MVDIEWLSIAVVERRGLSVQDADYMRNVNNAVEEACAHLQKVAGNPDLDFTDPDDRNLVIDCAWYFLENRRAEFDREYSGDLINLRMREGFGCGKTENSDLS
ncbi:MAG: hypothetical protein ACI3WQ_09220 [Faecousia sp.]